MNHEWKYFNLKLDKEAETIKNAFALDENIFYIIIYNRQTRTKKIIKSLDKGNTWIQDHILSSKNIYDIEFKNKNEIYVLSQGNNKAIRLYLSENQGKTWQFQYQINTDVKYYFSPNKEKKLVLKNEDKTLYESNDKGKSWTIFDNKNEKINPSTSFHLRKFENKRGHTIVKYNYKNRKETRTDLLSLHSFYNDNVFINSFNNTVIFSAQNYWLVSVDKGKIWEYIPIENSHNNSRRYRGGRRPIKQNKLFFINEKELFYLFNDQLYKIEL